MVYILMKGYKLNQNINNLKKSFYKLVPYIYLSWEVNKISYISIHWYFEVFIKKRYFLLLQGSESDLKTGKIVDYQTMLNKAIMIINIDETPAYGEHGFNIFIIGAQDDEECNKSIDRSFPVTAKIDIVIETFDDMRVISTVLTLALYILSGLLGVCLLSVRKDDLICFKYYNLT